MKGRHLVLDVWFLSVCVGFASLDVVLQWNLRIVPGMFVVLFVLSTHSHGPLLVGGSPMFPLVVPPASFSVHLASSGSPLRRGSVPQNPGGDNVVRMWVQFEEMMLCRVCGCLQRGHSGDGCVFGRRLCVSMILRKGDLFCFWAGQGCGRVDAGKVISSELLVCVVEVCAVFLLLPLVAICLEDNRCV